MAKKIFNVAFYVIIAFYTFLMLDLLFRFSVIASGTFAKRNYNLIPFATIWEYLSGQSGAAQNHVMVNILGNIAVFVPYGVYLQTFLKDKSLKKSFLIAAVTSLSVEILQFVLAVGAADVDDIILNTFGAIAGILIYKLLRKLLRDESRAKNAVAAVTIICGLPIAVIYTILFISRLL